MEMEERKRMKRKLEESCYSVKFIILSSLFHDKPMFPTTSKLNPTSTSSMFPGQCSTLYPTS